MRGNGVADCAGARATPGVAAWIPERPDREGSADLPPSAANRAPWGRHLDAQFTRHQTLGASQPCAWVGRCLLCGAPQRSGPPEQVTDAAAPVGECLLPDSDEHVLLEAADRVVGVEVLAVGEALELADVPEQLVRTGR